MKHTTPQCPHNRRFGFDYYNNETIQTCPYAVNLECGAVAQCRKLNQKIDELPTPLKSLNRLYREYQQLREDLEYYTILHGSLDKHKKGRDILEGLERYRQAAKERAKKAQIESGKKYGKGHPKVHPDITVDLKERNEATQQAAKEREKLSKGRGIKGAKRPIDITGPLGEAKQQAGRDFGPTPLITPPRTKLYDVMFVDFESRIHHRQVEARTPKEAKDIVFRENNQREHKRKPGTNLLYPEFMYPKRARIVYK